MTVTVAFLMLLQTPTDLEAAAAAMNGALDACIETQAREAGEDLRGGALATYVTERCEEERLELRTAAVALMTARGTTQEVAESFFDASYPEHLTEVLIEIEAEREGR